MDNIVVSTTHFVANSASRLYFTARMAVVVPAGIAARSTETPATKSGTPHNLHPINTPKGISINRKIENFIVVIVIIVLISPSARMTPMSSMVNGVEQLPKLDSVLLSTVGS